MGITVKRLLAIDDWKKLPALCALLLALALPALCASAPAPEAQRPQPAAPALSETAQRPNRILSELTSENMVRIAGSVHPLTYQATDLGRLNAEMRLESMSLYIAPSPAEQAELDALVQAQQDRSSPLYHQWLTQQQFGARFGLTDADLAKVTAWLASKGFSVRSVAPSRNLILFAGTVAQAEAAFSTQMHQYQIDGQTRVANSTELSIPQGLAQVVAGVGGLSGFRPHPAARIQRPASSSPASNPSAPDFTSYVSGNHYLSPADWATIYDVAAIYQAGYTGTGMHVGIAGQTYFPQSDIDNFRKASGLGLTNLNMVCISSVNCYDLAGESIGDIVEADLDVEWSGGIARDATVDFVYAAADDPSQDVVSAAIYLVTNYNVNGAVVPVISISYGGCETEYSASQRAAFDGYLEQAANQGQSVLNSTGDAGAAGCDQGKTVASKGLVADYPASSPWVTGVGGTTFAGDGSFTNPEPGANQYWSSSSSADIIGSAQRYIPETTWNDTAAVQALELANQEPISTLSSGGGGVSLYYSLPIWQWAPTNFSGSPMRFVPDVAFASSPNHDGYLLCTQQFTATSGTPTSNPGSSCVDGFRLSSAGDLTVEGGTSASSPSFAGMMTLLAEAYGSQGLVNQALYKLAGTPTSYAAVFHDITSGTNAQPCTTGTGCVDGLMGYAATTGYDLATGLGSIDGYALYQAMGGNSNLPSPSIQVTATPNTVTTGQPVALSATLTATAPGTITGEVTFTVNGTTAGSALISGGIATLSTTASAANGFTPGTNTITASYPGDTDFAAASASGTVLVGALPATTAALAISPATVSMNGTATLTATVTSTTPGTITGGVTFTTGTTTGITTLATVPLTSGTAVLSNQPITAANGFFSGTGNIVTATYNGNASYAASSASRALDAIAIPTTTTASASPNPVTVGNSLTLSATVTTTAPGQSFVGSVYFQVGSTMLGPVFVSHTTSSNSGTVGTFALTVAKLATYATGFSVGYNPITASYGGDPTLGSSSGATNLSVVTAPTYTLTATPSALSFSPGGGGTVTLNLTAANYTGTVKFVATVTSTNGTPSAISATAPPVSFATNSTGSTVLTIATTTSAANHAPAVPGIPASWTGGGLVLFAAIFAAPFTIRRRHALAVLLTALAITLGALLVSCSSGSGSSPAPSAHTYTITVTPAGSGTVANPAAVTVTLTVP